MWCHPPPTFQLHPSQHLCVHNPASVSALHYLKFPHDTPATCDNSSLLARLLSVVRFCLPCFLKMVETIRHVKTRVHVIICVCIYIYKLPQHWRTNQEKSTVLLTWAAINMQPHTESHALWSESISLRFLLSVSNTDSCTMPILLLASWLCKVLKTYMWES